MTSDNISYRQQIHILSTYFKDKYRTKYEKLLCLKLILRCYDLDYERNKVPQDCQNKDILLIKKKLDVDLKRVNRAPYGFKHKENEIIDLRDVSRLRTKEKLFIAEIKFIKDFKENTAKECVLINVPEDREETIKKIIALMRDPVVADFDSKEEYSIFINNMDEIIPNSNSNIKNKIEEGCVKLKTSNKKLISFVADEKISKALNFAFHTTATTKTEDICYDTLSDIKNQKKDQQEIKKILYQFQKKLFENIKGAAIRRIKKSIIEQSLEKSFMSIMKENDRIHYERFLCIKMLFALWIKETKGNKDQVIKKFKEHFGITLKPTIASNNNNWRAKRRVLLKMYDPEKTHIGQGYVVSDIPYTKEWFLFYPDSLEFFFPEFLETFMKLIEPITDNFSPKNFSILIFNKSYEIFDMEGEKENLGKRLLKKIEIYNVKCFKRIKKMGVSSFLCTFPLAI